MGVGFSTKIDLGGETGMGSRRQGLLLFFHQGALGDFVMTFPALVSLRDRFERIHAVCPAQNGRLAEALGLVDRWYSIDAAVWSSLYSKPVDRQVHEVLNAAAAILLISHSKDLADGVRACSGAPIYRIAPLPPPAEQVPVYRFLLDALSLCGLHAGFAKDEAQAARTVQSAGPGIVTDGGGDILIHPGAGSRRKRWPLDRFLTLADLLSDRGFAPRFLIGPAEEDLQRPLFEYGGGRYPLMRCGSRVELAAALRSASGFVGNDAGVAQLAGILGVPTAVIFGPADPVRWKPLGPRVEVLRPAVDCTPCFETELQNCDGERPRCLLETHPVQVQRAIRGLMEDASKMPLPTGQS